MDDIHPIFERVVGRDAKEALLGQRALVVWLYGLSGSGKSTIATGLQQRLHENGVLTELLDGDNMRTGLNAGLGFSDEDRRENIRRIAEVARLFLDCGVVTIASFITPLESLRRSARQIVGTDDLVEVFVDCPYEVCEQRDVKGLYAKAAAGGVKDFTGRDSGFEPPADLSQTFVLNTAEQSAEESVELLWRHVEPRIRRNRS